MRQYKITARNAWDTVEIGPFESYEEAKKHLPIGSDEGIIKEIKPLREVCIHYNKGGKNNTPSIHCINMAAHITDDEIRKYFEIGKPFNLGVAGFDLMAEVIRVEIIK